MRSEDHLPSSRKAAFLQGEEEAGRDRESLLKCLLSKLSQQSHDSLYISAVASGLFDPSFHLLEQLSRFDCAEVSDLVVNACLKFDGCIDSALEPHPARKRSCLCLGYPCHS